MQLRCLGSNSFGNCYLLESDTECLIIEAGIPFKEVKKALNFDISKISGVIISHEHGDHFKYVKDYLKAGIPVMTSQGTWSAFPDEIEISERVMRPGYWYQLENFNITPFPVVHDAVEPFGFIIRHPFIGTLLFATDTEYIKQNFLKINLNHIMIECNYSKKLIDNRMNIGDTNKSLRNRVLQSHMELETCKEFIRTNATNSLKNVVLLHLSDGNSDEAMFRKDVQQIVKDVAAEVFVADKGVTVSLELPQFQ